MYVRTYIHIYLCVDICTYVNTYVLLKTQHADVHFPAACNPRTHPVVLCTSATCVLMKTTLCFTTLLLVFCSHTLMCCAPLLHVFWSHQVTQPALHITGTLFSEHTAPC